MSWITSSGTQGMNTSLNPTPAALANAPHSPASMSIAQLAQHAQQQFNGAYNQYAQQGMNQSLAAQQYNQALQRQQQVVHHMWVWNGVPMDIVDFAKHAYGEDTPEATFFILKHKESA